MKRKTSKLSGDIAWRKRNEFSHVLDCNSQSEKDGKREGWIAAMRRQIRRRWIFLALSPIVLIAATVIWLSTLASSGLVNKSNFEKISLGMTEDEVNQIIGHYCCAAVNGRGMKVLYNDGNGPPSPRIAILFRDGRVASKDYRGVGPRELWDGLISRLSGTPRGSAIITVSSNEIPEPE